MPKGLPDSVIYGTYKRMKRTKPRQRRTHNAFDDLSDLVNGFAEIARILKRIAK